MASEVISHAIFASSHPTPARTALSSTPPPTPRFAPPRAALRLSLCPSHYLPPCTPLCIPPELHPAPSTPLFTLLCAALHSHPTPHHALHPAPRPPFPSLSLSQVSSSSRPPISHPRLSIPLCSSAKPLHPVLHPASHHALHPAHRPHSTPPISIALLCSPGFL